MADKIVVMRAGIVEQAGRPLDLYDRPANVFVASFIGSPSMNFLPGILMSNGVQIEGGPLVPVSLAEPDATGRKVLYGVRPEHLNLAQPGESGVDAAIELIEPTGAETQIYATVGGHRLVAVVRDRVSLKPGDPVRFAIDAARTHVFDQQTEVVLT